VETGRFSAAHAVGTFAFEVAGGTAVGLAVAWLVVRLRRGFSEAGVQLAFTLLTPYVAYVAADAIGGSGVLAAVAAGLYAAVRAPRGTPPQTRLALSSFWSLFVFLLNAILFLMIGVQLPHVLDGIGGGVSPRLLWHALALTLTVVGLRIAWMFVLPFVTSALRRGEGAMPASPGARLVLGWSGMRGGVSLAIALAVPLQTHGGDGFPGRPSVVFFAYAVVLLTLVAPGFTLGAMIRRLGFRRGGSGIAVEAEARQRLLHAALGEIEAQAAEGRLAGGVAERLRGLYEARLDRVTRATDGDREAAAGDEARYLGTRRAIFGAQRRELARLRDSHAYPQRVLRQLEHELDLEEARVPREPRLA
jgi:CPA1 family monovalent cation:H+ antiporter